MNTDGRPPRWTDLDIMKTVQERAAVNGSSKKHVDLAATAARVFSPTVFGSARHGPRYWVTEFLLLYLLANLAYPGGIALRVCRIAVVDRRGHPIGRPRALLRALFGVPCLVLLVAVFVDLFLNSPSSTLGAITLGWSIVGLAALYIAMLFLRPDRMPQDLVARTYLVPR